MSLVHYAPATRFVDLAPRNDGNRERLEIHLVRAPRPWTCSTCGAKARRLVTIQLKGQYDNLWAGICLWCIEQMTDAVEES